MQQHALGTAASLDLGGAPECVLAPRQALLDAARSAIEQAVRDAQQLAEDQRTLATMGFVMAELWRGGDAIDEAPADPFGRVAALGELVGTISSCYRRIAAQVAGRPMPPPDAFELSDPSALAGLLPDAKPSIRLADRLDGELAFQQAATVALTRSWRSPRETKLEAGMARLGMSTRDSTLQRWASALRFVTATPLPVAEAAVLRHVEGYFLNRFAERMGAEACVFRVPRPWLSAAAPLAMRHLSDTRMPSERGALALRAALDTLGSYYGVDFVELGTYRRMDARARTHGPELGYFDPLTRLSEGLHAAGEHELAEVGLLMLGEVNLPASRALAGLFNSSITERLAGSPPSAAEASQFVIDALYARDLRFREGMSELPATTMVGVFGGLRSIERFAQFDAWSDLGEPSQAAHADAFVASLRVGRGTNVDGIADELLGRKDAPTGIVDPGHERSGQGHSSFWGYEFDGQRLLADTATVAGAFAGAVGIAANPPAAVPLVAITGLTVAGTAASLASNRESFLERSRAQAEQLREQTGAERIAKAEQKLADASEAEREAVGELDRASKANETAKSELGEARQQLDVAVTTWASAKQTVESSELAVEDANKEVEAADERVLEADQAGSEQQQQASEQRERREQAAADAQAKLSLDEEAAADAEQQKQSAEMTHEEKQAKRKETEQQERDAQTKAAEATKQREKAEQEAKQIEEEERKRKQNDQQNPDGCAVDPEHLVNERNPARERDLLIIALHGTIYPADDARDLPDIDPATMLVLAAEKMRLSLASLINPLPPEQQLDPAPTGAPEHPMARIYPPRETFV